MPPSLQGPVWNRETFLLLSSTEFLMTYKIGRIKTLEFDILAPRHRSEMVEYLAQPYGPHLS